MRILLIRKGCLFTFAGIWIFTYSIYMLQQIAKERGSSTSDSVTDEPPDREVAQLHYSVEETYFVDTVSASEARNDALKDHLREVCRHFNISKPLNEFTLSHIHFDHKRQVLYCFTPKVACTSWKRIWMKLTGLVPPDKDLAQIPRLTLHSAIPALNLRMKNITEIIKTYKKFMLVRHPFDRVLSAFKDKLESEDKASNYNFHKEIGVKIQKKYRRAGKNYNGDDVTFSEFMRFISEPGPGTAEQTNEHWRSVHEICNPCLMEYDFIGKFETLKEDAYHVLEWIGASNLIQEFPVSDRPFHATRYDPKYFSQLDHAARVAFYNKFSLDYLAFNHSAL